MKKNNIFITEKLRRLKRYLSVRNFFALLFFLFTINNAIFLYNNLQNKTPIIGLHFENQLLIGKDHKQIVQLIQREALKHNKPLLLKHKDTTVQLSPSEIGYQVNSDYLANNLLQQGRTGTLWQKFLTQEASLLGFRNERLKGTFSSSLLSLAILTIQSTIDKEPKTITLDFAHNTKTVLPSQDGEKIQIDKLTRIILDKISNPPLQPLSLPMYVAFANQYSPNELDSIREQAISLLRSPISITSAGETFTLAPDDLKQMLIVVERPNPKNPKKNRLALRIDDTKLNQRLGVFATKVESITNAEFDDHDARIALYAEFYDPNNRTPHEIPSGRRLSTTHVLGTTDRKGPKVVYLTFDDGPNALYHPMILDILRIYHIQATFFLVGKNISSSHDAAETTVKDGHLIGNHSFTHSFLPKLGRTSITNELIQTNNVLQTLTNKSITLFRPPYGGINYFVINSAHQIGLNVFLWDVDPKDWSEPSTDELVRRVISATHDGSNILLHSNHLATVKALPKIIETLQANEYAFHALADYPNSEQM